MSLRIVQRSIIFGAVALLFHLSRHAGLAETRAVFATDAAGFTGTNPPPINAAAMVDGHIIAMEDVTLECLHKYRSPIVDQMLQRYILDRECNRRGLKIDETEIDRRIAELRSNLAPATLEDTLQKHRLTMAEARADFRFEIEKTLLVADQIKLLPMVHCRELVVAFGSSRNESGARAMATDFRRQTLGGASFSAMVAQHSEGENRARTGDMGVLYENILSPVEAPVLDAALLLKEGEVSPPIRGSDGYHLIKAESTGDHHPPSEDALYAAAAEAARRRQIMFLVPKTMSALIDQCHITFVDDNDLVPGKPLPEAAAVIDGHPIPMKDVLEKCMAAGGPKFTDILVQNYLVHRECERRGITIQESEIDERVEILRKECAPMTLDEGMKIHHTTLAGLRRGFRQEIERTRLAIGQVPPTRMVHVRIILAKADPVSESDVERADRDAQARIFAIQDQLKTGKRFEDLAARYCDREDPGKNGDMGILYPAKPGTDTAIVNAAIIMKKGDVSSRPIKAGSGFALLQALSDSDGHSRDEDSAYARALAAYRSMEAQRLIVPIVIDLIKKSNVTYYVHS
jgi:parvulin-like peptidyl-prolyl isomerase